MIQNKYFHFLSTDFDLLCQNNLRITGKINLTLKKIAAIFEL